MFGWGGRVAVTWGGGDSSLFVWRVSGTRPPPEQSPPKPSKTPQDSRAPPRAGSPLLAADAQRDRSPMPPFSAGGEQKTGSPQSAAQRGRGYVSSPSVGGEDWTGSPHDAAAAVRHGRGSVSQPVGDEVRIEEEGLDWGARSQRSSVGSSRSSASSPRAKRVC